MGKDYDFSGWVTRTNVKCSDGRVIMKDAFKDNDGEKVPLVWNHQHNAPEEVLGHVILQHRDEGVYGYGKFNDTESGKTAKSLVENGDIDKLSIYANKLKHQMNNVIHGCIREVSLVLAGANPGAYIDSIVHSEDGTVDETEAVIFTDESIALSHTDDGNNDSDGTQDVSNNKEDDRKMEDDKKDNNDQKTVADVFNTLNDEQKSAVYALIGQALEENGDDNSDDNNSKSDDKGEGEAMKHNVFSNDTDNGEVLKHSEIMTSAIKDAKKYGSIKESVMAHAADNNMTVEDVNRAITNITNWNGTGNGIGLLFPEATELYKEPKMIEKDRTWVSKIMSSVKHTPFSRVKTTFGKMSEDAARAKGYIKGNRKTNIQMAVINRVTTPTTVYIKNEIDRDDVVDITDFDVIAWQKKEMRKQLDKELALAMLLGDGRDISDNNKINEQNIRPVILDDDMYTIKYQVKKGRDYTQEGNSYSANDSRTKGIIRAAIRSRKDYKGSGKPSFYTTEDILTDMLLIEDQNGRLIYESVEKLATTLRVKEIVTIPEMEAEAYSDIYGVIVNMNDYTAGADRGGSVNMFDDFDIDFNQMKYLIETRMSGALTVPYSAIVLKKEAAAVKPDDDEEEGGGEEPPAQG